MDKFSYAIGLGIGQNLLSMGAQGINVEDFAQAIADVLNRKETAISHNEAREIVNKYFMELEEKMNAENIEKGKAFLEENVKAYTDSSMVEKIYKMVDSDNYAEKFSSLTGLAQGFLPVGEGGAYPKDERQEGYAKTFEHQTWKDSFTITQEMMEDSKILDLNRTGARGFVDAYMLTREKYGAQILVGAVAGTSTTFRGMNVDCTSADGVSIFSTAHPSKTGNTGAQSNKFAGAFSVTVLGQIETKMQNFTDDNGEILTVSPVFIITQYMCNFNIFIHN